MRKTYTYHLSFLPIWHFLGVALCLLLHSLPSSGQCTQPAGRDTAICGTGAAPLNVSGGSKNLYNWYDQLVDGNLLFSGDFFITPTISAQDTFYVAQYDTTSTEEFLLFDGTNDYVAIENYHYTAGGNAELTVECWVKTNDASNQIIASYDRNRYWRLEINGSGAGNGQVGFDLLTDAGQLDFGSTTRVDDNVWHHLAAVFDNGAVSIYIDGVLDVSTTIGNTFGNGTTAFGFVGTGSEASSFDGTRGPNDYFNGSMDEFRIWSVARSASEIAAHMDQCLTGAETGLEVYYRMDGTASADSAVDFSSNKNQGRLRNFTLPGAGATLVWNNTGGPTTYNCSYCESTRDSVFAEVNVLPSPDIGSDTCALAVFDLDAGAGYTSYTWNTGETSQMITADSSRFYFVEVESAGTPCVGNDGANVNLLLQPSGSDTARCGPGDITLLASGGSGKYYWYESAIGGTVQGTGNSWNTGILNSTDTFYLASIENDTTRQGLIFDGTNDYVSLDMFFNGAGVLPTMTVEAWVKTTVSGEAYTANWSILDFDRSDYFAFFVHGGNGTVSFSTADPTGLIDDFYGPTTASVNDGAWHHVVGIYDGTDKKIVVDGVLVATKTNPHSGRALGRGIAPRYGFIGDGSEANVNNGTRNNLYFEGELDEIRLWSDVRNLLEIQRNKDKCILGNESNLLTYYKMENGSGSSVLTDHSNQGNDGVLRNMNVNTSWTTTGPVVTCSCGSGPRDTIEVIINTVPIVNLGNDTCVSTSLMLDAGPNMGYLWQDGSTSQNLLATSSQAYYVIVDSASTPCKGADTILVGVGQAIEPTTTQSSRCGPGILTLKGTGQGTLQWFDESTGGNLLGTGDTINVGPLSSDSTFYLSTTLDDKNVLSFDGTDDYVAIDNYSYSSGGNAELTIECWIKTNDATDQVIASYDRNRYWRLEINGDGAGLGQVGFDLMTNAGQLDFGSTSTVNSDTWRHIAAVYDNGAVRIYIDGTLDKSTTIGSTFGDGSNAFGFLGTGSEATSFDGARGPNNHFNGSIDEFRIWSIARTAAEIALYKDSCLLGNEAGLELYYRMSTGSGSQLKDFKGNGDGLIAGASWANDGKGFACSSCSESNRIAVTAQVNPIISSSTYLPSCPGLSGSVVGLKGFGGSGNFDYKETTGIFNYSGSFSGDTVLKPLPNGGVYVVEVKDENNCKDTITGIVTESPPNLTNIASGSSSKTCRVPDYNEWFYLVNTSNRVLLAINPAGSDLGPVDATVFIDPTAGVFDGDAYMKRHFVINTTKQPSAPVGVRLYFTDDEYNNLVDSTNSTADSNDDITSIADLGVTKYNGPTEDGVLDVSDATSLIFINQQSNGTNFGQKYIQLNTPEFCEKWLHASAAGIPLPVEFLSFSAKLKDGFVDIQWRTASETNNAYFIIEKSTDGTVFNEIHQTPGQGNSSYPSFYQHEDHQPFKGEQYYRIKQVDYDNKEGYSKTISVHYDAANVRPKIKAIPNPTQNQFTLYGLGDATVRKIKISNTAGKTVLLQRFYDGPISISHLPQGLYMLEVLTPTSNLFLKILKQ